MSARDGLAREGARPGVALAICRGTDGGPEATERHVGVWHIRAADAALSWFADRLASPEMAKKVGKTLMKALNDDGWRCRYPDRSEPCTCAADAAKAMAAAVLAALREGLT